jgi:hypothetical protein
MLRMETSTGVGGSSGCIACQRHKVADFLCLNRVLGFVSLQLSAYYEVTVACLGHQYPAWNPPFSAWYDMANVFKVKGPSARKSVS